MPVSNRIAASNPVLGTPAWEAASVTELNLIFQRINTYSSELEADVRHSRGTLIRADDGPGYQFWHATV